MIRSAERRRIKQMLKALPSMMKVSRKQFKKICKERNFRSEKSGKMSAQAMYDGILKELY